MDLKTYITDEAIVYDKSWLRNHQPPCPELDHIVDIIDGFVELRNRYREMCEASAFIFLMGHIDRIHAVLCADPHATWRERAIQAAEAVEELPTAKKLPKDTDNGWLPATKERMQQLTPGDLVAYINYDGSVGILKWVLPANEENWVNWASTTKYMRVLDKPPAGRADKFAEKLMSQFQEKILCPFNAEEHKAVLAMIKEELGED